jgi:ADP-ribosylglycohydrolase
MAVTLRDKFLGCIAGVHIGSSMGAAVEGWPYQKITETYGKLDHLEGYEHYHNGWKRLPGTTEDGVERQKLMITAIIEKQDRVTAEDVKAVWIRDIKPISAGMVSEPFEAVLLARAKAGIPARDLGQYCDYAGLNSFARACHPIGLINAGNEEWAMRDIFEVGQLYQVDKSQGLQWAQVTGIGIAAATRPDATVDSVIDTILQLTEFTYSNKQFKKAAKTRRWGVKTKLEEMLEATKDCQDYPELRVRFDKYFGGKGIPYAMASASEVVSKALCIFRMVKGNTKEAIIAAVNMGRDTDCLAAVSAGIAGALTGGSSIPQEWIDQVDKATKDNIYTNSQRTLRESSDGLYNAFKTRMEKNQRLADTMTAYANQ